MTKPTTIQSIPQVNNNNNISSSSATAAVAFLVQSAITIITYLWLLLLFAYIGGTHLPACLPGYNIAISIHKPTNARALQHHLKK